MTTTPNTASQPRFTMSPAGSSDFPYFIVVDTVSNRVIAHCFEEADARLIVVKLNEPSTDPAAPKTEARR
jgi:hypothetical protein